jgi:small subunit ribosomal protein S17
MSTETTQQRGVRKNRSGVVVSDKMDKTIVVMAERRIRHAQYGKEITRTKKFYAHDEKNEAKVGDVVRIEEARPLSRLKRWRLVEVVTRAAK